MAVLEGRKGWPTGKPHAPAKQALNLFTATATVAAVASPLAALLPIAPPPSQGAAPPAPSATGNLGLQSNSYGR